ncbi:hypothetical protein BDZ89DRAFT_691420 [Hymenopellis radicata]|nr:hypothetical protein BDZ89DRAFT_691420 [Hymenopellis radicata]
MSLNPLKHLSPRKNTKLGDGYLKDATEETKKNSDKWRNQDLADVRRIYTAAKDISDDLHERLDDSGGLAALTTLNKGFNYRKQALKVRGQAEHLTSTTTERPLAPHSSKTAKWQALTSKERLKVLDEDADFMKARPPDEQSIRTRATDGDSSQGHDGSFVVIEGLPASAISMSRKNRASAAPAHSTYNPPAQPTAHPNSSRDDTRPSDQKRLVRKTDAGVFYDGQSAAPNMQQPVSNPLGPHLTSLQGASQIAHAPRPAPPSHHSASNPNSSGTRPNAQRVSSQGGPLQHTPTYASQLPPSHRSVPDTYYPAAGHPPSVQQSASQDASPQRVPTYASQVPPSHQSIPQPHNAVTMHPGVQRSVVQSTSLEHSPTYTSQAPSSHHALSQAQRVAAHAPSSQAYTSPAPTLQRYGPTSAPVPNATMRPQGPPMSPSSQQQSGASCPIPSTRYMTNMPGNTMGPPMANQNPSLARTVTTSVPPMYSAPHQNMATTTQGYPYTAGANAYGQQYSVPQDPYANLRPGEAETRYAPSDERSGAGGNIPPSSQRTSNAHGGNSGGQASSHRRPRYPAI